MKFVSNANPFDGVTIRDPPLGGLFRKILNCVAEMIFEVCNDSIVKTNVYVSPPINLNISDDSMRGSFSTTLR